MRNLILWVMLLPAIAQAQTETQALLKVSVTDFNGTPRVNEKVIFVGEKKEISGITGKDGSFEILLDKGNTYTVNYLDFSTGEEKTKLEVPNVEGLMQMEMTFQYEAPKIFMLNNLYFETAKAEIKSNSFAELNQLAELMQLKPAMQIEIGGHTDNIGTAESNLVLSKNRSEAVKKYLVSKGIASARIQTRGYGDTQPVSSNEDEAGRSKNRRTEVKIITE